MDKHILIQQYFQKVDQLTVAHKAYAACVHDLCQWLLQNDAVSHDTTTALLFSDALTERTARIFSKKAITVAGVEEISYLLDTFTDIHHTVKIQDGASAQPSETILELYGSPAQILAYERTILNMLQRLSGIATTTNKLVTQVQALRLEKTPMIAATRKVPWTLLDKKAVALGGGGTHRLTLADGILVKDNHLLIVKEQFHLTNEAELVTKTFAIVAQKAENLLIEIEVEERESIEALIKASQTVPKNTLCILLDNFSPEEAKATLDTLQKKYDLSPLILEASGGITDENILDWAKTGVDVISLGALTHSTQAVDISLEVGMG